MSDIGKPERETQNRTIALFRDALGYRYLADWSDRKNRNVEEMTLKGGHERRPDLVLYVNGIKATVERTIKLRETIRNAGGETLDLKPFEADMRHLIDTCIEAGVPRKISPFDDMGPLELIAETAMVEAIKRLPDHLKGNRDAAAEIRLMNALWR